MKNKRPIIQSKSSMSSIWQGRSKEQVKAFFGLCVAFCILLLVASAFVGFGFCLFLTSGSVFYPMYNGVTKFRWHFLMVPECIELAKCVYQVKLPSLKNFTQFIKKAKLLFLFERLLFLFESLWENIQLSKMKVHYQFFLVKYFLA